MQIKYNAFKDLDQLKELAISSLNRNNIEFNSNIESFAFNNLQNLTTLKLSGKHTTIESFAFNNLPILESLKITGPIFNMGEDALKDLISLVKFEIVQSKIQDLPRIFSNCPSLTHLSIQDSELLVISADAFIAVSFLFTLKLDLNKKLKS